MDSPVESTESLRASPYGRSVGRSYSDVIMKFSRIYRFPFQIAMAIAIAAARALIGLYCPQAERSELLIFLSSKCNTVATVVHVTETG